MLIYAITEEKSKRDIIRRDLTMHGEVYQFEQGGVLQWNLVESRDLIVLDSYWNILLIDPVKSEVTKTWPS